MRPLYRARIDLNQKQRPSRGSGVIEAARMRR
jgi:hypothetical protein